MKWQKFIQIKKGTTLFDHDLNMHIMELTIKRTIVILQIFYPCI